MKRAERLGLFALAVLIVGVFLPRGGRELVADKSSNVLMSAQARTGIGLATITSGSEDSAGRWLFQYVCRDGSGNATSGCRVHLELSNDGGTTWSAFHVFDGSDEVFAYPTCGSCAIRAWGDALDASHKATIIATASGATTASAPTYTATSTPTATATATRTPTHP